MWKKDKTAYKTWLQEKIQHRPERSHGFRYKGQYQEQIATMVADGQLDVPGKEQITERVVSDMGEASSGGMEE
jgi:hypothetical protein